MRFDALSLVVRPRSPNEAFDLGLRLTQVHRLAVSRAMLLPLVPVLLLAEALDLLIPNDGWVWMLCVWWFKPVYDRFALLVFAQAVFGQASTLKEVRRALPSLLRSGILRALSWARLGTARSFVLPVWQLEGLRGRAVRVRTTLLLQGWSAGAVRLLSACALLETVTLMALLAGMVQMIPGELRPEFPQLVALSGQGGWLAHLERAAYVTALMLVEPFYVAAGFALYLSRRTELEGWDIELAFRALAERLATEERVA